MGRSKYINTFNTTAEYDAYIDSSYPEFPNVGYDKEAGEVKIMRTSPNDHLFYGELVDATQNIPQLRLKNNNVIVKTYTPTVDTLTNEFYIDDWGTVPTFNRLDNESLTNKSNIKSIKKFKGLDTSSVNAMNNMFAGCSSLTTIDLYGLDFSSTTTLASFFDNCSSLTTLDLSDLDFSNVTNISSLVNSCRSLTSLDLSDLDFSNVTTLTNMFFVCSSLTDVYITVEATLMKLTNNLTSQGNTYIPSNNGNCTIHYNGTDYKWQNNAWTPQS